MADPQEQLPLPARVLCTPSWASEVIGAAPLTIVVPFMNYDVAPLAQRLLALAARVRVPVPMVFVDDGSTDPRWWQGLWVVLQAADQPVQLAVLHQNVGRARVRNDLCQRARSPYLLYLDADMWPDDEQFIERYLAWIAEGGVDVIYGGRSARKVLLDGPDHELHRRMTIEREALPAAVRRQAPAYQFYSCNFVVRRDLLAAFPLDPRFTGWGWEDCEWAARVAQSHAIRHEDNSASHLGLLTAEQILRKYDESIGNFRLIAQKRPDLVRPIALCKVARLIGRLHLQWATARVARALALSNRWPYAIRMRGLMFYKAALYAPVVVQEL